MSAPVSRRWRFARMLLLAVALLAAAGFAACGGDELDAPGQIIVTLGEDQIAGTLRLPPGDGPRPLVIAVPGTGDVPRSATLPYADFFVPEGYAFFAYDRRGTGASTGEHEVITLENSVEVIERHARDVSAIVDTLAQHERVDADGVVLLGLNEGGWIATLAASMRVEVDALIAVNGGASPVGIADYFRLLLEVEEIDIEEATARLEGYDGDTGYDPAPVLESVVIPVLWLYGAEDRQNPSLFDVASLKRLAEELEDENFTIELVPDADHDLFSFRDGRPDPAIVAMVVAWLDESLAPE